jgi:hypothetical protein
LINSKRKEFLNHFGAISYPKCPYIFIEKAHKPNSNKDILLIGIKNSSITINIDSNTASIK